LAAQGATHFRLAVLAVAMPNWQGSGVPLRLCDPTARPRLPLLLMSVCSPLAKEFKRMDRLLARCFSALAIALTVAMPAKAPADTSTSGSLTRIAEILKAP
jgi:hypothetical protein